MRPSRYVSLAIAARVALTAAGCGERTVTGSVGNPDLEPFVGTWDARVFTVTADADTTIVADLVQNGSFVINVQPSGTYTATLVFAGLTPIVEIGQLTVSGGFVTLRPNQTPPCPVAPQRYQFTRSDYLILGPGPTCFPFRPGELDPGQAYIELERR
jgi:hypothetical protein